MKSSAYQVGFEQAMRCDAASKKRSDKLKCKPGYVQRGAACQKIKPGASKVSSPQGRQRGRGAAIAGMAAIATAGGGAALLVRKQQSKKPALPSVPAMPLPENRQPAVPQSKANWKASIAKQALYLGGSLAAGLVISKTAQPAIVNALSKSKNNTRNNENPDILDLDTLRQVQKNVPSMSEEEVAQHYERLSSNTSIEDLIHKSSLKDEEKEKEMNELGEIKASLLTDLYKRQGLKIVNADLDGKTTTFKTSKGSLNTVGSVGAKVFEMESKLDRRSKSNESTFDMSFTVDNGNTQNTKPTKEQAEQIAKNAETAYRTHLENLPDNCTLRTVKTSNEYNVDYEEKGFEHTFNDEYLYATKKEGKFAKVSSLPLEEKDKLEKEHNIFTNKVST